MQFQTLANFLRVQRSFCQLSEEIEVDRAQQSLGAPEAKPELYDCLRRNFFVHGTLKTDVVAFQDRVRIDALFEAPELSTASLRPVRVRCASVTVRARHGTSPCRRG